MSKAKGQIKRDGNKQNGDSKKQLFLKWANRHRRVLILASVLIVPACVLGLVRTERDRSIAIIAVLSAFLTLACGALTIAVAQVVGELKAIRDELVMIRARVNTELLDDMAADLTALRTKMDKGLLGLLHM